jgi:hypothetical protein
LRIPIRVLALSAVLLGSTLPIANAAQQSPQPASAAPTATLRQVHVSTTEDVASDEPYLQVNGKTVWGPRSVDEGDNRTIGVVAHAIEWLDDRLRKSGVQKLLSNANRKLSRADCGKSDRAAVPSGSGGQVAQEGVRLSFGDPARKRYRHVLLVDPTGTKAKPDYRAIDSHAGGIAWYGYYLYVGGDQPRHPRLRPAQHLRPRVSKHGTTRNRKRNRLAWQEVLRRRQPLRAAAADVLRQRGGRAREVLRRHGVARQVLVHAQGRAPAAAAKPRPARVRRVDRGRRAAQPRGRGDLQGAGGSVVLAVDEPPVDGRRASGGSGAVWHRGLALPVGAFSAA